MHEMSVIVPAHNEATVIERCLRALAGSELEIIVVCNGCEDDTAALARAVAPAVTVLELETASKAAALNAGDAAAHHFPRFYVDADVEVGPEALRACATALMEGDGGVLCVAPTPVFALEGRPKVIRAFYDAVARMPYYASTSVVGNGVYGLSRAGRARFGAFPSITSDDQYVTERFRAVERRRITSSTFTIHTPRTLTGLLQMRTRVYRGNAELARHAPPVEPSDQQPQRALVRLLVRPSTSVAALVYLGVNLVARRRARRAWDGRWERDTSARVGVA